MNSINSSIDETSYIYQSCHQKHLEIISAIKIGAFPKNSKKIWVSAGDRCVCKLCKQLNKLSIGIDEYFAIDGIEVLHPPLHNGCRCTQIYKEG